MAGAVAVTFAVQTGSEASAAAAGEKVPLPTKQIWICGSFSQGPGDFGVGWGWQDVPGPGPDRAGFGRIGSDHLCRGVGGNAIGAWLAIVPPVAPRPRWIPLKRTPRTRRNVLLERTSRD